MVNNKNKSVKDIGERKLTDIIADILGGDTNNFLTYPEDAVGVGLGRENLILTTDSFVASTDMPPLMGYYDAGYKSVIMNISDLIAKGATPKYMLISICLPKNVLVEDFIKMIEGIKTASKEYNVPVLGGDTNQSEDLVITGFAFGTVDKKNIMFRKGSQPGDLLAVTGLFGLTSVALKILLDKKKADKELEKKALASMFRPEARIKEGLALAASGTVTACIDSSDGLLESLRELMRVNHKGFVINELPVFVGIDRFAKENNIPLEDLILKGGEEYELVLTIKPDKLKEAKKAVKEAEGTLKIIGKVIREEKIIFQKEGKNIEIRDRGFEHFST